MRQPSAPRAARTRRRLDNDRLRIGLALAAALVLGIFVETRNRDAAQLRASWSTTAEVVVTSRALESGHVLSASDIVRVPAPAALTPDGAVADVVSKVLARAVPSGAILTDTDLVGANGPPSGLRWMSLPVDGAATPRLARGDVVDLLGADPFGGSVTVVAAAALVVESEDERLIVEVDPVAASRIGQQLAAGPIIAVLVGR